MSIIRVENTVEVTHTINSHHLTSLQELYKRKIP